MTRLRNNSANVVEPDTSDSDTSFSHSKQIDDDTRDDTRDDDDDEIEIVLPRNVSNEIPRSSVFRRVSTEVVPAPPPVEEQQQQRKVSGDKPRKVTFDSSPTSAKKTVVAAKGILKKPEPAPAQGPAQGPYAVMLPLTPTQVLNQEPMASTSAVASAATENNSDQSSRGSTRPHRLHLPRRPSRSSTLDSVMGNVQVAEVAQAGKPRQVVVESSSSECSSPVGSTSTLAKEIARELVKEVKLLQPEPVLPPRPPDSPPALSLDTPAESSPVLVQVHRPGRLGVRRRQQAWRQRRVVRKAVETGAYVDKVVDEVNARAREPPHPTVEPVSGSESSTTRPEAPSFYWDPSGAFEFYTSTQWWDQLRDRANSADGGSRSYRKQLFLTVDGAALWLYASVTGCVTRVRSRCESVMGLASRLQARFGWSSDGGAVPA